MTNANVKNVMRQAILQTGYKEYPAGSNKTKFGKAFGMNGVPWCFIYEWWCGETAKGKNPFPHNANAAYGQDDIVNQMGGKWIMPKTASSKAKKNGLKTVRFGDCVDFDFGRNNLYRQHTALAIGTDGEYYICIEGNTSSTEKGSQSNGGCVAIRKRHYTSVCSIARPKYGAMASLNPLDAYGGTAPTLPKRGYFRKGDKGDEVKRLQRAINWSSDASIKTDGVFGNETLFGVIWYQHIYHLALDGEFGKKSLAVLKKLIANHKPKAEKIVDEAKKLAWKYGTAKATYAYPNGKPKKAYTEALDEAFPNRKNWSEQTKAGASCDVFVATALRASGVDPTFPRGLDEIEAYVKKNPKKWTDTGIKERSKMKPGDVIFEDYGGKGTGAHACIYLGGDRIAQAQHTGKTYPHIRTYTGQVHDPSKDDVFKVYRIKE